MELALTLLKPNLCQEFITDLISYADSALGPLRSVGVCNADGVWGVLDH